MQLSAARLGIITIFELIELEDREKTKTNSSARTFFVDWSKNFFPNFPLFISRMLSLCDFGFSLND